MATNWITNLLSFGLDRAFPNLFEVEVSYSPMGELVTSLSNLKYRAESIDLGDFSLETDFNESMQIHTIKNAERIKEITITFRETSTYEVLTTFKRWMNSIYNFDGNYFNSVIPYGTINICLGNDGEATDKLKKRIIFEEAMPTSIEYPSYSWSETDPLKIIVKFSVNGVKFDTNYKTSPDSTEHKNAII